MKLLSANILSATLSCSTVAALSISEINGNRFLSPYQGQSVTNVTGLVTAKGPAGIWLRSMSQDSDSRTSDSIYVYGSKIGTNLTVGDVITLDGKVSEYRSSSAYIYLTELSSPTNVVLVSTGSEVEALVLGEGGLDPPTEQFTSLDNGDVFGMPNNSSQLSTVNPVLEPTKYAFDFWESLSGELVTVKKPTALRVPNSYGDTWVVGSWKVTGKNGRGGLTMTVGDANPEAIIIGSPLDGSNNPTTTKMGDSLDDITGVITQAYGYYAILPLTNITVTGSKTPALPDPTKLKTNGKCNKITFGSYNVENLTPTSSHLGKIADHIVNYLKSPVVMFLQEVQDNNGATNDAVVDANVTLSTLVDSISAITDVRYDFIDVSPVDDTNGGEPGGNIRNAYLWNPEIVRLRNPSPGNATVANEVLPGPALKYNPGLIDPLNAAFDASRKPLVANWETLDGSNNFFTVNVHFGSKGGSSSIEGDARPPVNGGIDDRLAQVGITANFIADILKEDADAGVITSGDFNEFAFAAPLETFASVSTLHDLDEVADIDKTERYTYAYDMNSQQLDHIYVSSALSTDAEYEHIHINTWVTYDDQASDHDPSVAKLNVCQK